jgi:hypothetical protein
LVRALGMKLRISKSTICLIENAVGTVSAGLVVRSL